jgi:hypothetical protein
MLNHTRCRELLIRFLANSSARKLTNFCMRSQRFVAVEKLKIIFKKDAGRVQNSPHMRYFGL